MAGIDWSALQRSLDGRVVLPDEPEYEWTRKPFIARFDEILPQAVVMATSPQDVATAVAFARRHGIHLVARSGGHCFAGYSSTSGIVVNVSPMNSVGVDGGLARVGAGARIGDMTEALIEHGVVVPSGSCPTVGIGGTTLGGGIGVLGRLYGLTCDHLESAEIVLGDGRVLQTDAGHDPDLLWALRGAGSGNFGVVTALTFRPRPAPRMTNFYVVWDFADAAEVLKAWQRWAPHVPEEMTAGLGFTAMDDLDDPPVAELFGAMVGTESDGRELIGQLVERCGREPVSATVREMSYRQTGLYQAGLLSAVNNQELHTPKGRVERQGCRFTKGEFFDGPIPDDVVERLAAVFPAGRTAGEVRGLELAPWGGGYSRPGPRDTAFVHRDTSFSLKHAVMVPPEADLAAKEGAHKWVSMSWQTVHPWGSGGVYPNFPDPDLADWATAYYGENLERLTRIKSRYDPDNVFTYEQSIPLG